MFKNEICVVYLNQKYRVLINVLAIIDCACNMRDPVKMIISFMIKLN